MDRFDKTRLLKEVEAYAAAHKGKIYAPICHPEFAHIPSEHGHNRFELIQLHIPAGLETALDIGTHWGYFAHRLEEHGLKVTAAEYLKNYLPFLRGLRDLYGDSFEIYDKTSVLEMPDPLKYDVVLALAIFHHFIKTEVIYNQFISFLRRLDCKVMFFQAHNTREGQMANAFRNFEGNEFCEFIIEQVPNLTAYKKIGETTGRPMYLLS